MELENQLFDKNFNKRTQFWNKFDEIGKGKLMKFEKK